MRDWAGAERAAASTNLGPTAARPAAPVPDGAPVPGRRTCIELLIMTCYLVAAVVLTWRLWADPATRFVAGNTNDADQFAWFFRYDATAVLHARLPSLVTAAMNAPQGINVMWNTSMLLPGVLLAPVTLLLGPQTSLTILMSAGFAGSAAAMFVVLRRWEVSVGAAALAGAVYGFSPALVHSAIGHDNLQFAVLPPLIIDACLRLCVHSQKPVRDGAWLGLLATAQFFTGEELLLGTAAGGLLLVAGLAAARPRAALRRLPAAATGLAAAGGAVLLLAGYPLWVQFFGPLTQRGSAFTADFFKNDLTGFVVPSRYLLFHTSASAAAAARYPGGAPEYLAYLGWPLLILLAVAALVFWRSPAVRVLAVTIVVLEVLSLGKYPLIGGIVHPGVSLPWGWLAGLPVLGAALPERLSIIADGAAAALLAVCLDLARSRFRLSRPWMVLVVATAVAAVLPLIPLPLPAADASPLPAGWPAAFAALRLPPGARVLVVPVPTATLTGPLRWAADTGEPASLIGGYFTGPGWNGQAYVDGNGVAQTAQYLDALWAGGPAARPPARAQAAQDIGAWQPAAVVAVANPRSALGRYLISLFHRPAVEAGSILAWRT
jgi:hypothetical protein